MNVETMSSPFRLPHTLMPNAAKSWSSGFIFVDGSESLMASYYALCETCWLHSGYCRHHDDCLEVHTIVPSVTWEPSARYAGSWSTFSWRWAHWVHRSRSPRCILWHQVLLGWSTYFDWVFVGGIIDILAALFRIFWKAVDPLHGLQCIIALNSYQVSLVIASN